MNAPPHPIILTLLATALAMAPSVACGDQSPAPSIGTIRGEVDAGRQKLRSLYVESITRSNTDGKAAGAPLVTRHVLAADGPKRYTELAHWTPPLDWSEDIGYTQSYFTGETFDVLYVLNRYYETLRIAPGEFPSTKVRAEFYIECTGWWPPDDTTLPPGLDPSTLLHLALADPSCRVLSETGEAGGVRCVVVEIADRDRLWLDPSRGFAIVRREFTGPSVRLHYENSDFREAVPGVWLPWRVRRVVTAKGNPGAGGDGREVILSDADRTIGLLQVNNVDDAIFTFHPEPGTLICDLDRKAVRQVPGGLDMLDDIVRAGRKFLPIGRMTTESTSGPPSILAWTLAASSIPALIAMGRRRARPQSLESISS